MQPNPLKVLLDAAGIDKVIWIDDLFAPLDEDKLKIRIKEKLAKLEVYNLKPIHKVLCDLKYNAPIGVRDKQIDETLYSNVEILNEIHDSISQQLKDREPDQIEPKEDLTHSQVEALLNALTSVQKYSYITWKSKDKDILRECSESTLILIDREFVNEGASPDAGDEILAMVIERAPSSCCILLTHTVPPNETENLRKLIAYSSDNKIKIHQFSVMSKREIGAMPEDAEPHLASSLRISLTHRLCFDLANESATVMEDSLKTAVYDLINLSIYDLDKSIFENSLNEGSSELDVINRILFLRQRIATKEKFASDPEIHTKLKRMREIRTLQEIRSPLGLMLRVKIGFMSGVKVRYSIQLNSLIEFILP